MVSLDRIAIFGGQGSLEKEWEVPEWSLCDGNFSLDWSHLDLERRGCQYSRSQGLSVAEMDANLPPVLGPLTSLGVAPALYNAHLEIGNPSLGWGSW